jgi:transcriptional regulator with XRE-family HTH domain
MVEASESEFLQCVGSNVRRWRLRCGLTQEELATRLSTAPRHVQRIERGEMNMSLLYLRRVARVLGTEPGALLRANKLIERKPGRPKKAKAVTRRK